MSALTDLFSNIATSIRAKTGSDESIVAINFPSAIAAIESCVNGTTLGSGSAVFTVPNAAGKTNVVISMLNPNNQTSVSSGLICACVINGTGYAFYKPSSGSYVSRANVTWDSDAGTLTVAVSGIVWANLTTFGYATW